MIWKYRKTITLLKWLGVFVGEVDKPGWVEETTVNGAASLPGIVGRTLGLCCGIPRTTPTLSGMRLP